MCATTPRLRTISCLAIPGRGIAHLSPDLYAPVVRSAVCLAGILAICALAHAQGEPDAGVAPDASVSVDAGVDAAPVPPVDAAPHPVDAAGEADASVEVAAPVLRPTSRREDAAWLLVGGALTFVTTAVVLAYAAESTETDIEDLYVS